MQVDTGSDTTLIPVNFWQNLGKLKLQKSTLQLKQFDGTIIKILSTFKGTFETKKRFEIIPITDYMNVLSCRRYSNRIYLSISCCDCQLFEIYF